MRRAVLTTIGGLLLLLQGGNSFSQSNVPKDISLVDGKSCEESSVTKAYPPQSFSRRDFLAATGASVASIGLLQRPETAVAAGKRYVLNDETGDYDEVDDPEWQTEWKSRLDKIQTMSSDEVFAAARGAGNTDLKKAAGLEESPASKKRRALSGCRDDRLRQKAGGVANERECTAKVLGGETDFMLDVM